VLTKQTAVTGSGPRELATFAAGCFWGIELAFQRVPGVVSTQVGYTHGTVKNPTYEQVCSGRSGHAEAVQVEYDKHAIGYKDLLTVFWDIHDPTTLNRQGNDAGTQYRSGIYFHTDEQESIAKRSMEEQQLVHTDQIVTEILPAVTFYPAEEYHQKYLEKGGQCSLTGDLSPIRCYG
jgi:peptide-methionine (S)-S-oxide reductase